MESPAYPPDMTPKEEQEEEIRIRGLENGPPIDMQKVLIGSKGSWVSKRVWKSSLGARFALGLLLRQTWEVKIAQTQCVCIPEEKKKNPWLQKAVQMVEGGMVMGTGPPAPRLISGLRN